MSVFKVKDLMINVMANGGGGAGLCAEDVSVTVPSPLTPYVLIAANQDVLKRVQRTSDELMVQDLEGEVGKQLFDQVAFDLGRQIVVAAIQGSGGGSVGLPPDDGSPVPSWATPVVHEVGALVQPSHLPRIREQLKEALAATDAAERALVPDTAAEVRMLTNKLEGALEELGASVPQGA